MKKKLISSIFSIILVLAISSCAKQSRPPSKVQDPNPESERIYGDKDGPARQSKLEYPTEPSHIARADAIRQKLFSE